MVPSSAPRPLLVCRNLGPVLTAALVAVSLSVPARAQAPVRVGTEFQVNTYVLNDQTASSVAMDADGDFVVAWASRGQDGSAEGVYAQRYGSAGDPLGSEFRVNTTTADIQTNPSVAMDADGDFVVVWQSRGPSDTAPNPINDDDVLAQRYDAAGQPQGPEFQVNTYTGYNQNTPSVAMEADGDFVVAWTSRGLPFKDPGQGQDGSSAGVYAQRFSAAGTPLGTEFQVNTYTVGDQSSPSVAVGADGRFVVAWTSTGQDGDFFGVFAQRYSAAGTPLGAEFQVNTLTYGSQSDPAVGVAANGDFVIAWSGITGQGGDFEIYAQRYDAAGAPQGGEFRVNTFTTGEQSGPSVARDADGGFVVVWSGRAASDNSGVSAQKYSSSGEAQGPEFLVNTRTTESQSRPSVAMAADGRFAVAWSSYEQESEFTNGVYGQLYKSGPDPVASEPGSSVGLTLTLAPVPVGPAGTRIRYDLPEAGTVRLAVYDVLGREVAVLASGAQAAGPHEGRLEAGRLAAGVYIVRLEAGRATVVRRVTVAH